MRETGKSDKPRELTENEVRSKVLSHVWGMIKYWDEVPNGNNQRGRLEGLAFSILSMLDGSSMSVPKMVVAPDPHPEDRAYHEENGEDWFPENHDVPVKCDLGGSLHELFHKHGREHGYLPEK